MQEQAKQPPVAEELTDAPEAASDELVEQLAVAQARADEYRDSWQRERADFVNYRRRVEAERADIVPQANAALLTSLLPVIDDFDLALVNVPAETADAKWVEGILLIQRKLLKLLETAGVTPIMALGQPFDPHRHEAVVADDGAVEPYVVVADLRRGYMLRDRVLRPSMVKVGSLTKKSKR